MLKAPSPVHDIYLIKKVMDKGGSILYTISTRKPTTTAFPANPPFKGLTILLFLTEDKESARFCPELTGHRTSHSSQPSVARFTKSDRVSRDPTQAAGHRMFRPVGRAPHVSSQALNEKQSAPQNSMPVDI